MQTRQEHLPTLERLPFLADNGRINLLPLIAMLEIPSELISSLDQSPEPHIIFDAKYCIVYANRAYIEHFKPEQDPVGRLCYEVSHHYDAPCDKVGESCPRAASLRSGRSEYVVHLHHTPKGEEYVDIKLTPIMGRNGSSKYFIERMMALPVDGKFNHQQHGRSPQFKKMMARLMRVAPSQETVLLMGETGTGKELAARAIHAASPRADKPFVTVDCTGLPENLIESELFGHQKGAFTGAIAHHKGLVELADGGTLFLDEIGDMPLSMQSKLLRLLEAGTFRRVGASEWRHVDIRIVAATLHPLAQMVAEGRFRTDLYYRLSVFPIMLPPLRQRHGDIPLLAVELLRLKSPSHRLTPCALKRLEAHDFPGNIRELRNILTRCFLLSNTHMINGELVENALSFLDSNTPEAIPSQHETAHLETTLSRREQAKKLGISERTLYRILTKQKEG